METIDRVTNGPRDERTAYAALDRAGAARVVVALFGLREPKRIAPLPDQLVRNLAAGAANVA